LKQFPSNSLEEFAHAYHVGITSVFLFPLLLGKDIEEHDE